RTDVLRIRRLRRSRGCGHRLRVRRRGRTARHGRPGPVMRERSAGRLAWFLTVRATVRVAAAAAVVAVGPVVSAPVAAAGAPTPDDFTNPDQSLLQDSVVDLDPGIVYLDENVEEAETTESSGGESVITLATDILFAFDSAELSSEAEERIAEIAEE